AWDEPRRAIRIFALHRIRRATPTTESYEVPRDFGFKRYMADAFGIQQGDEPVAVSIRFAPRQARWIRERRWHRSARVQEALNGGLVLHLRVAETSEIKRWVLQFGSEAEVLKPASLRRAVMQELAVAMRAYRDRRRDQRNHLRRTASPCRGPLCLPGIRISFGGRLRSSASTQTTKCNG